jgi:hypothetical protein
MVCEGIELCEEDLDSLLGNTTPSLSVMDALIVLARKNLVPSWAPVRSSPGGVPPCVTKSLILTYAEADQLLHNSPDERILAMVEAALSQDGAFLGVPIRSDNSPHQFALIISGAKEPEKRLVDVADSMFMRTLETHEGGARWKKYVGR